MPEKQTDADVPASLHNDGRVPIPVFQGDLAKVIGGDKVIAPRPNYAQGTQPGEALTFNTGHLPGKQVAIIPSAFTGEQATPAPTEHAHEIGGTAIQEHVALATPQERQ